MRHETDSTARLALHLYHLEDIRHLFSREAHFYHDPSLHGLLVFKEAEGEIVLDGRKYPLHRQQIFLLGDGDSVKLTLSRDRPAEYYYIRFHALMADRGQFAPAKLPGSDECRTAHFPWVVDKVREVEQKLHGDSSWDAMKANILFQELLLTLFKDHYEKQRPDVRDAIALTMSYMEQHYQSAITREKLAEMAGLNPDYYSRAFKKQVDQSPMEYLANVRMKQAKQLLVQSGESLRSIANKVGFSDEFYFSRRFKAETGYSPMAYVKKLKQSCKVASLNHQATGHLMALGIEPYAAVINNAYPVTTRLRHTIEVGRVFPDLEKLMSARPDVILTRVSKHEELSSKEKMFHQIAPTVTLSPFDNWRVHFRKIAKIVGKEQEADEWLERYAQKASMVGAQFKRKLGEEAVLVLGIGDGKMCVYGQRNMGSVLYDDLGLNAPDEVREIGHYREVTLADLSSLEADRIIVTSYRHDGTAQMDQAIRKAERALAAHPLWQALSAVRNQKVLFLSDSQHLYTSYNAFTHDLFLNRLQELLLPDSADHILITR